MNIKNQLEQAISELKQLIQPMDTHAIADEARTLIGSALDAIASGNAQQMYAILAAIWVITMRVRGVLLAAVYDGPDSDEDLRGAVENFDRLAQTFLVDLHRLQGLGFHI